MCFLYFSKFWWVLKNEDMTFLVVPPNNPFTQQPTTMHWKHNIFVKKELRQFHDATNLWFQRDYDLGHVIQKDLCNVYIECYVIQKIQNFIWNALFDYYNIFIWIMVDVMVWFGNSIMLSTLTLIPLIWFGEKPCNMFKV